MYICFGYSKQGLVYESYSKIIDKTFLGRCRSLPIGLAITLYSPNPTGQR
jgi:hypothetical protein